MRAANTQCNVAGFRPGTYILRIGHYQGRFTPTFDKAKNIDVELRDSGASIALYMESDVTYFKIGSYGYLAGEFWNVFAIDGRTRKITECTPALCPAPALGLIAR
jgi:hypothetical protein